MIHLKRPLIAAVMATFAASAMAGLESRLGGAAYYDSQLNTTFVKDANLAATMSFGLSGIDAAGAMSWSTANTWISQLNASNYLGFSDWRLPTVKPINGANFQFNGNYFNGSVDLGYNLTAPGSMFSGSTATELPYLFYNDLHDVAAFDTAGVAQSVASNNSGPLRNLYATGYWTSQRYGSDGAMAFDFSTGTQYAYAAIPSPANGGGVFNYHVEAVRTGDVAPVPEPASVVLMMGGSRRSRGGFASRAARRIAIGCRRTGCCLQVSADLTS